jgi:hypothetical protein
MNWSYKLRLDSKRLACMGLPDAALNESEARIGTAQQPAGIHGRLIHSIEVPGQFA